MMLTGTPGLRRWRMHFEELSPEICNLARLNHAFRGAVSSDAVWEAKLPSNYLHLLQILSHPDACETLCKKDIFALLSRPHPFDDGNKIANNLPLDENQDFPAKLEKSAEKTHGFSCREQTHLPVSVSLHITVTFAPVLNPVA